MALCVLCTEACNTERCLAWPARCPGSSIELSTASALLIPAVECSGHGECARNPTLCRAGDPSCVATCVCQEGWSTSDCSITAEELVQAQSFRASCLGVLVRVVWLLGTSVVSDVLLSVIRLLLGMLCATVHCVGPDRSYS